MQQRVVDTSTTHSWSLADVDKARTVDDALKVALQRASVALDARRRLERRANAIDARSTTRDGANGAHGAAARR